MPTPPATSLVDYIEASAARFPERTAIADPAGWSLTYAELDRQSSNIAGFLVASGVEPGDRVGVIVPKGAQAIVAFVGIMKGRAAYVPADFTAPPERNRSILSDCQVKAAILAGSCGPIFCAPGATMTWRPTSSAPLSTSSVHCPRSPARRRCW